MTDYLKNLSRDLVNVAASIMNKTNSPVVEPEVIAESTELEEVKMSAALQGWHDGYNGHLHDIKMRDLVYKNKKDRQDYTSNHAEGKKAKLDEEVKGLNEMGNTPYVKKFVDIDGIHKGWKASNKRGKVRWFGKSFESSAKKHAGFSEDLSLEEQAAELNELSKATLRSYTSKASETLKGRGRKSGKQIKRASSVETAKEKLTKILDKEHSIKRKIRAAQAADIQGHFQKEAPKVLAKHGFSKVHGSENSTMYHKGHDNGHSTLVRIIHSPDSYLGSKFSVHGTSGYQTSNGHNHIIDDSESSEQNKTKMMHGFESHLIRDHDNNKRWVHEEVNKIGEVLEEGRRGRPPKDAAKRAAFNTGEDDDDPRMHIIAQLNKVKVSSVPIKVQFKDGSKHEVHSNHAEKILSKYSTLKPNEKINFQHKVGSSHASFQSELR